MSGAFQRPREHPRDQLETSFTPILRELFLSDPAVVAAVFVDREGECVDYCGSVDPYEIKVAGAHMQVVLRNLRPSLEKLALGELGELHIHANRLEIVIRRIDEDYACIVMRREGGSDDVMLKALDATILKLREVAGLHVPHWDIRAGGIEVGIRESLGWGFAPDVIHETEGPVRVDAVLGRWEESGGLTGRPLVCFRVHTENGHDVTLVYDEGYDRWYRW